MPNFVAVMLNGLSSTDKNNNEGIAKNTAKKIDKIF